MKKIILILALLSLGVSKAQVVGGYLPLNSTKSATMGGLRVNGNETVTGTFSVGSTATITGVLTTNSVVANTGQLRLYSGTNSDLILRAIGASQAITSEINGTPKFQVNSSGATVTGSLITTGTHSLGSANLTGGNTGTVAVLSDVVFAVNLGGGLVSTPADGSTYYYGNISGVFTQQGFGKLYMPYNVTLIGWTYNAWVTSVASSSESSTLSINIDNSATNLNTSITFSVASGVNTYSNSGLSINVNSGSYIEAKLINPTWATNPQGVNSGITFLFVRRS